MDGHDIYFFDAHAHNKLATCVNEQDTETLLQQVRAADLLKTCVSSRIVHSIMFVLGSSKKNNLMWSCDNITLLLLHVRLCSQLFLHAV